jgi:hypothetical protein
MFNFNYEMALKLNKYFPAISRALYLSTETISRLSQFHETILLKEPLLFIHFLSGFGPRPLLYSIMLPVRINI